MFNGIQIRAFGWPSINKCNVIRPEGIHSVTTRMVCGIIMLSDTGIILKQWDNVAGENFISIALGIHIPFDNDEISAKAMCNDRPDEDRTPTPKTISVKYATVGITFISPTVYSNPAITSMNGKPRLARENEAIPLLSKPALVCACPIYYPFPKQALVFTCLLCKSFETLWEKEKLLVTSNIGESSAIFIKFKINLCKLFQFGRA